MTKSCRKCGEEKPSPEFRPNPRCSDGLSSWCAECHNEATRLWRRRRREAEWEAAWARRQAEPERLRRYEAQWRARVAEAQAERTVRVSCELRPFECQSLLPSVGFRKQPLPDWEALSSPGLSGRAQRTCGSLSWRAWDAAARARGRRQ